MPKKKPFLKAFVGILTIVLASFFVGFVQLTMKSKASPFSSAVVTLSESEAKFYNLPTNTTQAEFEQAKIKKFFDEFDLAMLVDENGEYRVALSEEAAKELKQVAGTYALGTLENFVLSRWRTNN
jgi:hypothetical protein